ncbi:AfsR/SARP family transcriptional regulator [Nonomuraea sp. bgisy101]|uniref:AfsR/SARP family transcriptional regulator n=1 Tax=Nonomuraea sp. bgisy101 TaxID=3413784 RepID=UPI003D754F52
MTVRFHVLGQVEVTVNGEVLDLGHRQRELLAFMLLHANETVDIGRLVEVSFPDPVPDSARRQVQNTVGRLRRALAAAGCPEVIRTRQGGYLLELDTYGLDLLEYGRHVEAGRKAAAEGREHAAVTHLRRGLALWRGPLLAGIDGAGLDVEANAIESERRAVLEECLELELQLGRHQELVSELAVLTEKHPLCERLWGLRMLALYRCGAKADALAVYQAARTTFVKELGLEPGRRLRSLEQAILTEDASIDLGDAPRWPRPRQLPPDVPGLTGGSGPAGGSIALATEGLDPAALRLLAALSLADGRDVPGWTVLAMGGSPDLADGLVGSRLLQASGHLRYRVHDPVRAHTREAAGAYDLRPEVTRMLCGWLSLVRRAHRAVYGGDFAVLHGTATPWDPPGTEIVDSDPLSWYEIERPNLVAAVRQAAGLGLDELCWDLAVSAVSLFQTRGHYDDWAETHRVALVATRAAGNTRGSAALLTGIGLLEAYRHRYERAAAAVEEALTLFERCGDRHGRALARSVAAFTAGMRGRYGEDR